jgi:molybdenum cofactor cytidylyltransferase
VGVTAAVVLLAAGEGSRFAGPVPKLRVPLWGRPLLAWALDAAAGTDAPLFVVTGAIPVDDLLPPEAQAVPNPDWASGQATSVRAGIAAASAHGHDAVIVGLGDQPLIPAEAYRRLVAATGDVVVATYDGRRRNPVRLGRRVWDQLPEAGDEVGRAVMRRSPSLVGELACPGTPVDIDTEADLDHVSAAHEPPE